LETCQNISDSLAERATEIKPLPAVATSTMPSIKTSHDALNKLKVCTARYKQLRIDHDNARADLNLKKEAHIRANRALNLAESSYEKLGHRANNQDNEQINAIRKQVNDLQNDVNKAEQTVKSLDRELSYSPTQMEITRGEFAFFQSTEIIRQALINAALVHK
jgi:chromosome segregation ATPase